MATENQFRLLRQRRFAPFFATQFLGALNDNIFRNGLAILVTFQGIAVLGLDIAQLPNVAAALFVLPFFLFSATAGQLADRYEKSMLMRRIKLAEIALMSLAAIALACREYEALLAVLFLMGCQSTLFGPVKYAYLPQKLDSHELIGGNALVESGTYVAIILGLIIGTIVIDLDVTGNALGVCLVVTAIAGWLAARRVPKTPAVDPGLEISLNAWRETWRIIGFAREKRSVFLSVLGISWFWFFGSAMTVQVPAYTVQILQGTESVTLSLLAAFAIGVGVGSLLCERLSAHRVELGLVPFGSIGLSLFAIDLYFAQPMPAGATVDGFGEFLGRAGTWRVLFDLAMLGVFGAFYSVPLYALIQERSERRHLSRIIAANNIINSAFMAVALGSALLAFEIGLSIPQFFLALAVLNALVAAYIYTLLPEFLMRFVAWLFINVIYRVRIRGIENIPKTGPAIVVCNHVSFMDPIILGGCVPRPLRFVMYYRIFEIPLLKAFFRQARAIPIASAREDKALMEAAFEAVDAELAAGNVVCIFPEGGITRDGKIARFRPGIERILEQRPVPVVPVALGRLWGSWFSRSPRRGLRRLFGRLFARVPVTVGRPVAPASATAARLEILVRTLRGDQR